VLHFAQITCYARSLRLAGNKNFGIKFSMLFSGEPLQGCLAQMYHNGRGLTANRLKALTVIHNFGLKRVDGTTAAERLFETQFLDLFTWLVNQMGELPLPRRGKKRTGYNPLNFKHVPA